MSSWMDSVRSWLKPAKPSKRKPRPQARLGLESLEVRDVPSIVAGGTAPQVGTPPSWTAVGPVGINNFPGMVMPPQNTVSGAIERIAFDPFNPNRAVAGAVNGGAWITNDIQSPNPTWFTTTDNLVSLAISSVAFSPVIPNQVFIGTGSYTAGGLGVNFSAGVTGKGDGGAPGHIFRSDNGGATWTEVGGTTFGQRRIRAIVPTAINGGRTVFAAITDNTNPTNMGVYRSDNSGVTWVRVSGATGSGLPSLPVTDLIPDARNDPATGFQRYYAALISSATSATGVGIYMLDAGAGSTTWVNVSNSVPSLIDPNLLANASRIVLASSPAGAGPLYVGIVDGDPTSPTFLSASAIYRGIPYPAGNTFIWSAVGNAGRPPYSNPGQQGDIHFAIAADPFNENLVYVGGDSQNVGTAYGNTMRGDALANTWTTMSTYSGQNPGAVPGNAATNPANTAPQPTTAPHADIRYMKFAPDGTLLATSDGGLFRVTNPQAANGQPPTWSSAGNNIQAFEQYSAAIDDKNNTNPADDGFLVGAQDNGTSEGTSGTTFQAVTRGDGVMVLADPVGGYRYYSTQFFALNRRDPNGTLVVPAARIIGAPGFTLNPRAPGTPIENMPFVTAAVLNQSFPNEMLVGGNGTLYISFDHGDSFRSIGGLNGTNPNVIFPGTYITGLAFGTAQSPNAAYVATDDGELYFIPDVNNTASGFLFFTNFSAVALGRAAIQIVVDPNNPLIAYAVTDRGVFRTQDGTTWTSITGNILTLTTPGGRTTLSSLALFTNNTATSNDDALMVGGYGGVFTLGVNNTGGGWTKFSTGIPDVVVTSVVYDPRSDSLVAGTYGRGIWKVDQVGTLLSPGLLVTVTGDFNDNTMAVWPDLADPRFFFVSDGLGNVQRFDSSIYRAVSFKGLSGKDTILVGTPDGSAVSRADLLTINVIADGGGNPGDSLVIDDRADFNPHQVTVTPSVFGHGPGDNLFGPGGGGSYTGFNTGSVLFEFGSGVDTLKYDDTNSTAAATYTLAGTRVAKTGSAPVDYSGLEQLVVAGSSGANTYQVNSTTTSYSTTVVDGIGNSTFNIRGDGLTGANTFNGFLGNDVFNLTAGAGLTGPVQVTGGGGTDNLNVTGRTSSDSVTFALTNAVGGGVFTGFGQYAGVDSLEAITFDGRSTNSLTYVDRSGIGFGTPTDPDGGIVYTPLGAQSGRVVTGRGQTGVPTFTFNGVGGDFAAGGVTDVLTVYGVSDTGLAANGELTAADGRDTVTVSDQQVTINNSSLGQLRSITLLGGADTVNTLFVKTGNEKGPEGDTVTATASAVLNIVIDGGQPTGTTPGDRVQVIGTGSQNRVQTTDPTLGPPQIRVTFTDGSSLGLINFENSSSGVAGAGALAVGSGPGVPAMVQVIDPVTGQPKFTVFPFGGFDGGVTVATGDVTGDGVPDVIVGAGPGGGPLITVYDGVTQAVLGTFYAFEATFTGGVNVSMGDFNRDGIADIVIGTGIGGGPRVKVLDGKNLQVIRDVFVYEPTFRGGVSVAVGDVNQDGTPDLITSAGSGGGPRVVIFDGANLKQLASFYVFDPSSRNGFNVASGDVTGDGVADVIVGAGTGDTSLVRVFSGTNLAPVIDFNVDNVVSPFGDIPFGPGVRVGAADVDGDSVAEVVVGMGPGTSPTLRYYQVGRINPKSNAIEIGLKLLREDAVFDPFYSAGIYVGQSAS